jgi:lipopolysaccharide transport system ATP-binding protein
LSKQYRLGGRLHKFRTLRDTLTDFFTLPFRRTKSLLRGKPDGAANMNQTIWALREVSFEVKRGEVVGIIGPNGAGKTTLLKILSRITEPTEGFAEIHGRVGSLLEVGTGFHPELTGRENIYLNGAILGMKKAEIEQKFDEIVDFAEIEKFIDTPVKHYSSGMYVRLAFSVAAHLEPEILIIDEVLAVGDAAFQRKCLGKMRDDVKEGRTVLFVSHNLAAIDKLCQKAIWIDKGRINMSGSTVEVISAYEKTTTDRKSGYPPGVLFEAPINEKQRCSLRRIEVVGTNDQLLQTLHTGDTLAFRIHYHCSEKISSAAFTLDFSTPMGIRVLRLSSSPLGGVYLDLPKGEGMVDCIFEWFPLAAGIYKLGVGIAIPHREWLLEVRDLSDITVSEKDVYSSGFSPQCPRTLIAAQHSWQHVHLKS